MEAIPGSAPKMAERIKLRSLKPATQQDLSTADARRSTQIPEKFKNLCASAVELKTSKQGKKTMEPQSIQRKIEALDQV